MAKKKTNGKKTAATGKRRAQGKRRVREESCWWALPVSCLMILILAVTAFLAVHEISENRRFRIMRAAVESDGFYSGIIVEGYALTDVTLDTALKHWEERIEPAYADRTVTLTYNGQTWSKTCRELGYSSNYREVLGNAWSRARSGTLEQRYRSLRQIGSAQERYEITRTLYDEAQLRAWTDGIAASLTVDPVNAQVTGFDVDTRKFTFASSAVGYSVDADALYRQASAALNGGGATVQVGAQGDGAVEELRHATAALGKERRGVRESELLSIGVALTCAHARHEVGDTLHDVGRRGACHLEARRPQTVAVRERALEVDRAFHVAVVGELLAAAHELGDAGRRCHTALRRETHELLGRAGEGERERRAVLAQPVVFHHRRAGARPILDRFLVGRQVDGRTIVVVPPA